MAEEAPPSSLDAGAALPVLRAVAALANAPAATALDDVDADAAWTRAEAVVTLRAASRVSRAWRAYAAEAAESLTALVPRELRSLRDLPRSNPRVGTLCLSRMHEAAVAAPAEPHEADEAKDDATRALDALQLSTPPPAPPQADVWSPAEAVAAVALPEAHQASEGEAEEVRRCDDESAFRALPCSTDTDALLGRRKFRSPHRRRTARCAHA